MEPAFGQTVIKKFQLREEAGAQHQTYAIGLKEVSPKFLHLELPFPFALVRIS
jgi:hypothetical protein